MQNCKQVTSPVPIDAKTYAEFVDICNKGIKEKGVKGVFYAAVLKSLNDPLLFKRIGIASDDDNLALNAEYISMPDFLRAK